MRPHIPKILWSNAKLLEEKYNCKFVFEAPASSTVYLNSIKTAAEIWYANMDKYNVELLLKINQIADRVEEPVSVFAALPGKVTSEIFNKIISLETPVTTALSANESLMQSIIDAVLDY